MPAGFTLVEVLVAMVVTLILMGIVVNIFGLIGDKVSESRATMEMTDQLRGVKQRLQADLMSVTVTTLPPRRPELDQGYSQVVEGPVGRMEVSGGSAAMRQAVTVQVPDENGVTGYDTTVGDNDDFIMFTIRSTSEPFVGRFGNTTLQSPVAEVAWFLRGTTLYRRVLLVKPSVQLPDPASTANFYASFDVSMHFEGDQFDLFDPTQKLRYVANSLGDLTKRENRFAHMPRFNSPKFGWPHDVRFWGGFNNVYGRLALPTLQECSHANWWGSPPNPLTPIGALGSSGSLTTASGNEEFDAWSRATPTNSGPNPWNQVNRATGILNDYDAGSPRVGEDVILTNVLQFDIKVWDPLAPVFTVNAALDSSDPNWLVKPSDINGTTVLLPGDPGYPVALVKWVGIGTPPPETFVARGAYVDLNYGYMDASAGSAKYQAVSHFSGPGDSRSGLAATPSYPAAIYDTWSTHYEHDGINQRDGTSTAMVDEGTDGFDSDGDGIVDNPGEPYTDTNQDGDYDSGEPYTDLNNNGRYDAGEKEAPPPYAHPLRGIQIKIRVFEPDSRQIREATIVQDFLPE